jgi:hypothetical protein
MSLTFINYLTGDGDGIAVLIDRELTRVFGPDMIFRAGRSIPPGADWEAAIHAALRRSHALVAVIGPRWLDTMASISTLDRNAHWTQREIQAALDGGMSVIPMLIGQTPRLSSDGLPPVLAELAKRQYIRLEHTNVDAAIERLTTVLAQHVHDQGQPASGPAHRNNDEPAGAPGTLGGCRSPCRRPAPSEAESRANWTVGARERPGYRVASW